MGNFQDNAEVRWELGADDASAGSVIIKYGSDNMIRTQVSLDEREYALAKKEAKALGIPVAEYVRRAIRETLPATGAGAWMRYAGLVESGNRRSSQSIDDIVYGAKD
jgi:hypothetical protein